MSVKPEAVIYTDGSCLGNPGPGGWASIVIVNGVEQELSGGDAATTNNRMELLGVINGLKALRGPHIVTIYSDSKYITDAFNRHWLKSWKSNGWTRKEGPLKNQTLWKELDALVEKHVCTFIWVRGHAGNRYNERCDRLAVLQSKKYSGSEKEQEQNQEQIIDVNDAICALDTYIRTDNKDRLGIETPCGSLPICDFCGNMRDDHLCAWAYMEYLKRTKEKDS